MTKLKVEYLRLALVFVIFVFIVTLLFLHINQVKLDWFEALAKLITIPALCFSVLIPIWMIVDLIRKKVADKSIFNLTFFICVISILLLLFTLRFLN